MKRAFTVLVALCLLALPACAQVRTDYRPIAPATLAGKNYYFTALLQSSPQADSLLRTSPELNRMAREKLQRLETAQTTAERIAAMKFSETEIAAASEALARLYAPGNPLDSILTRHLIPSGCYQQYALTGARLLQKIWQQDAHGMNYAIDVYAAGRRPNYPASDSTSFNVSSTRYERHLLPACQQNAALLARAQPSFYAVPMASVRTLLDANNRLEAIDFEPLDKTENHAAYAQVNQTKWSAYPYTAILVLGCGPDDLNQPLSIEGRLRTAYAAALWRQRLAPFIIVSGGRVSPRHTPYSEAYEMKQYLMQVWHVPAHAIIMEPHARHTTTNLRNAARILLRRGFPEDRFALVTSSAYHIDDVAATTGLPRRCQRELGHVPYRTGRRLSARVLEIQPLIQSFIINPTEPLDP